MASSLGDTARDELRIAASKGSDEVKHLHWLYKELLRVEGHWTRQVQNQQQRISSLLTVTGILLAFLASASFLTNKLAQPVTPLSARLFLGSLVLLCFALLMGILALKPSIPIAGTSATALGPLRCFRRKHHFLPLAAPELWLDARRIHEMGTRARDEAALLDKLCESAAQNAEKASHQGAMLGRRLYMLRQIALLIGALVLLVVALLGFMFE